MFPSPGGPNEQNEELLALREECRRLRQESERLQAQLEQIAQVVGSQEATRLVHDVRNIMNELVLLRKLVELEE